LLPVLRSAEPLRAALTAELLAELGHRLAAALEVAPRPREAQDLLDRVEQVVARLEGPPAPDHLEVVPAAERGGVDGVEAEVTEVRKDRSVLAQCALAVA
jgi:hypothetical protein